MLNHARKPYATINDTLEVLTLIVISLERSPAFVQDQAEERPVLQQLNGLANLLHRGSACLYHQDDAIYIG
jgi:hypothetical protein